MKRLTRIVILFSNLQNVCKMKELPRKPKSYCAWKLELHCGNNTEDKNGS